MDIRFVSVIFILVSFVLILLGFAIRYCLVKHKKNRNYYGTILGNLYHRSNYCPQSCLLYFRYLFNHNSDWLEYVCKEWEVARDNVVFIREVGKGSFGMVYKGLLRNTVPKQPEVKCAVKMVIPIVVRE